ncbi:hypothetical protein [Alicyclobacillus acidoterrestris]|uniref:Uncharacterized protein n=1 Tax=Alicyclobacillus acidoterrestris (strain ATCC 49025 / DSM 3922 / CIP 106132 / NCIMB 13137 / GD3B) TaxID=1356854 RepID=T0BKZ2_ALIAG|nr:hypothetical protein [Alicyclobacillus acidoterrestris]EPZ41409.1 hypothetical protein N007_17150 [Alicyclobacillus acidoterrestris ATCC 49025]UNO48959.1 hypothetical protein K1I37_20655 [Alicyclobacillus acidoterrestris]
MSTRVLGTTWIVDYLPYMNVEDEAGIKLHPVMPTSVQLKYVGRCEHGRAHLFANVLTSYGSRTEIKHQCPYYMVWNTQRAILENVMERLGERIWITEYNPFHSHEWSNMYGYPTEIFNGPIVEAVIVGGLYLGKGSPFDRSEYDDDLDNGGGT